MDWNGIVDATLDAIPLKPSLQFFSETCSDNIEVIDRQNARVLGWRPNDLFKTA